MGVRVSVRETDDWKREITARVRFTPEMYSEIESEVAKNIAEHLARTIKEKAQEDVRREFMKASVEEMDGEILALAVTRYLTIELVRMIMDEVKKEMEND